MSRPTNFRSSQAGRDPRKIGGWARTYAQNRSLGVVVSLVLFGLLTAAIAGPSYLGGVAYRHGQWALAYLCIAVTGIAVLALLVFSVPRWNAKLVELITERLYAGEGCARLAPPCTVRRRRLGGLMAAAFLVCVTAGVALGMLGVIPDRYMQPVSAIYCVPFLVGLWLLMRPAVGLIALLWPALYALHAVLILAGAPILFVGRWEPLNMLIPTVGYGLLCGLLSHAYSRYALWRLRRTACDMADGDITEGPQQ
jgi:hypothetical protein